MEQRRLAGRTPAVPQFIVDDALGRKIAELNKLRLTGTLGVLLRAKAKAVDVKVVVA